MTQTIQKTGKSWKAIIAASKVIIFIASPVLFFTHHGGASAAALMVGVALYVVGKIGAWWNHG